MMRRPKTLAARSLWTCLLAILLSATIAGGTPSSAAAVVVVENNFAGSGTLKLTMNSFSGNFLKCTSSVKGTASYPPNEKASITEWTLSSCSIYRENKNVGSATVNISTNPAVEAVKMTTLYFSQYTAKATFKIGEATCNPEFTILANNPVYTSGSTANTIESFPISEFIDWTFPRPEACEFSGSAFSEATFSFNKPQFKLTEWSVLPSMYYLRNSNTSGPADSSFNLPLQQASDIPISGDWDSNGVDTVGFFRPSNATFYLSNTNSSINVTTQFGATGDRPVVGDWNNDGTDTIGVYRPSNGTFYLSNSNSSGAVDYQFQFGNSTNSEDLPVAGDWDHNGTDTIGVYRPTNGYFYLRNSNSSGSPDYSFAYGNTGSDDLPVAGDWDGNGYASVGIFRQSTGHWFLDNEVPANQPISYESSFGPVGHTVPIVGNWDGKNGTDTTGAVWK